MISVAELNKLRAVLWKNVLLKVASPYSTLAELLLPVLFVTLLIFIKEISTIYDSPTVAMYCGNAEPFQYEAELTTTANSSLYACLTKPPECDATRYYRGGFKIEGVRVYDQYGYIDTPSSEGVGNGFPLYQLQVGDTTSVYETLGLDNPSLPFPTLVSRLADNGVLLALSPKDSGDSDAVSAVDGLRDYMLGLAGEGFDDTIITFESENDMEKYVTNRDYNDGDFRDGKVAFAVTLYTVDTASMQFEYSVRVNYTSPFNEDDDTVACLYEDCEFTYQIPTTKEFTDDLSLPQVSDYMYGYTYSGFSELQRVTDQYFISLASGLDTTLTASMGFMPTQDYKADNFALVIANTLGLFYMLSFLYPVSRIIRGLVLEKEMRIKEGMKMMGLSDAVYNASWAITLIVQLTAVSGLITLVTSTTVFEYSDKGLVFLYFFAFAMSVMTLCFALSSLFSKSKTAALLGPLIFFAAFFPYYAVSDAQYSTGTKAAACLLAPTCFSLGATVFANFEGGLVGLQTGNTDQLVGNFSYSLCIALLFADAVLYGLIAWYLDKVFPSEYGTQQPWYFPVTRRFWCGAPAPEGDGANGGALRESLLADRGLQLSGERPNYEAPEPELLRQVDENKAVVIRGLRKVFATTGADRVAVAGLDLEFFENQISVLLGHNGAGKSTTISMLTGLIPVTSGDAWIRGLRVTRDMLDIRHNLGVCPQHDILFDELTVMQHLRMFALFKGVPSAEVEGAARRMVAEVGLVEKADYRSANLSGGQKRKLSVGIALIGGSEVVILDEPTSGMDPYSRRSTWNIIQRAKRGRIILLTTHFMDEADHLGDRISIMAEGRLCCSGSSMFLKSIYGVGYTLTVVKTERGSSEGIGSVVRSHVPEAEPLSDVGAEVSFRLPFAASPAFVGLFTQLDNNGEELGVAQYGISVTTLEEVFLRVGHGEALPEDQESSRQSKAAIIHRRSSAEESKVNADIPGPAEQE